MDEKIAEYIQELLARNEEINAQTLAQVAHFAQAVGEERAWQRIQTEDDAARQLGISARRVRAIAKLRHEQRGVGYLVPGANKWIFRPSDIEWLRPGALEF